MIMEIASQLLFNCKLRWLDILRLCVNLIDFRV